MGVFKELEQHESVSEITGERLRELGSRVANHDHAKSGTFSPFDVSKALTRSTVSSPCW